MDSIFIFGAKYLFLLVFLIAGLYFLRQPRAVQKKMVIFSLVSLPLIYLLATLAGSLYYNPRPFVAGGFIPLIPHIPDNGFPSDHVLMVSAVAAIICFFSRKAGLALLFISILVGISRVYVGVHHPIDVIASMIISFAGASVGHKLLASMLRR